MFARFKAGGFRGAAIPSAPGIRHRSLHARPFDARKTGLILA